ncbi:hypothetical protein AKJ36_00520 [candidate division MSBL1 archaeon SCGC-AAA259I07]|uniref:Carbohydrate kinase PfkB domain-containing protein n=1 Tax=candidate division MSBL1 archaeon SCGC-AAA259I07 TaxID=1698266 RepID=A0A133UMV9_9EURY|nr:hypothetical protein AKJ36_00520 [candidate division MSBL1 archaeon SCGC-AAA259I07]
MQIDTVVAGHITVDVNVLPHGIVENVLGGTPTYAGFALTTLGHEPGVVSKIGKDFPEHFPPLFSKFGLNTEGLLITSHNTTKFENTYSEDGEREQVCKEVSPPIKPEDIPQVYLDARGFYISPVMSELPPETVSKFSEEGKGITMLDPQGIFRELKDSGKIQLRKPDNFEEYLKNVDVIKVGRDELKIFDKSTEEIMKELVEMGPKIAILTLGAEGCKVSSNGEITEIKSLDVEAEDLTGAGDVFGAAFLSHYLETRDPIDSAKFANAAAGLKVKYKGPTGFPSEKEIKDAL